MDPLHAVIWRYYHSRAESMVQNGTVGDILEILDTAYGDKAPFEYDEGLVQEAVKDVNRNMFNLGFSEGWEAHRVYEDRQDA